MDDARETRTDVTRRRFAAAGAAAAISVGAAPAFAAGTPGPAPVALSNWVEIAALLEAAPYVRKGGPGPVVWDLGFRLCPPCTRLIRHGVPRLVAAGLEVRSLVFAPYRGPQRAAPSDEEVRTVAEIYRTRDARLLEAWHRFTPPDAFARRRRLPDAPPGSEARARVEAGLALVNRIGQAVLGGGAPRWGVPALLWGSGGQGAMTLGFEGDAWLEGPLAFARA